MQKIKKAVIPCGGCGTRFLPITKAVAKEMLTLVDRPCLDYIVDELVASGIEEILLIVSPDKEEIKRYYSTNTRLNEVLTRGNKTTQLQELRVLENKAKFYFACQQSANGSANAMLLAEDFVNGEPFAIALGDDLMVAQTPVTAQLIQSFDQYGKTVHGVQRRAVPEILSYGVIEVKQELSDGVYLMDGIKEKPAVNELPSDLAGLGRYVVTSDIFDFIRQTPVAKNGELQFTDSLHLQARANGAVAHVFEGTRYDIGNKLGSLQAIVDLALNREDLGGDFRAYLKSLKL